MLLDSSTDIPKNSLHILYMEYNDIQLGDATLYTSHGGLTISDSWTLSSDRVRRDVDLLRNFTRHFCDIFPTRMDINSVGMSRLLHDNIVTRTFSVKVGDVIQ